MTSGVYQLTFPRGKTYIGKSINIEERWKQHLDKMTKGTAAANMQAEYNRYGRFDAKILVKCHEDHIDIMEACLINRLAPELNGTRPADPLATLNWDDINNLIETLKSSTLEHILCIGSLRRKVDAQEEVIRIQDNEIKELQKDRCREELDVDVHNRIAITEEKLQKSLDDYDSLDAGYTQTYLELMKFKNMSFWQRLFA